MSEARRNRGDALAGVVLVLAMAGVAALDARRVADHWQQLRPLSSGDVVSNLRVQPLHEDEAPVPLYQALGAQATLVDFWATWCEPCKQMTPTVLALSKEFKGKGVKVLSVSVDEPEDYREVKLYAASHHFDFPVYTDPKGELRRAFTAHMLPTFVVLDGHGRVARIFEGLTRESTLRAAIEDALAAEALHE